jgi:hypothetical protein
VPRVLGNPRSRLPDRVRWFGEKLAVSLRAPDVVRLDCNHWPLLQKPAAVAEVIEKHGKSQPGPVS